MKSILCRAATAYRFEDIAKPAIREALACSIFSAPGSFAHESYGFVPTAGGELTREIDGVVYCVLRHDEKLLPACVINAEAAKKAAEIEEQEGFKPGRKRLREIREHTADELLAKAFIRTSYTAAWFDFTAGKLVIAAAGNGKCDRFLKAFIGGFQSAHGHSPAMGLWRVEQSPAHAFTRWITGAEDINSVLTIDHSAVFTDEHGGRVAVKAKDLQLEPIRELAAAGLCSELALTHNEKISFVLSSGLVLRSIAFLDIAKIDDQQPDMLEDERIDAEIILMSGLIRNAVADLSLIFGGELK